MIRNYIKIAFRNLSRQKLYSLINISGLAIGLAVCMLIMLYVAHELSYDRFHANANRIFVVKEHLKMGDQEVQMYTNYVSGPLIKQNEPNVISYIRVKKVNQDVIVDDPSSKGNKLSASKMMFADAGFFNFFSFKLLSGNPASVLTTPFSLVITRDMAKKYFGNENPVGKTLKIKTETTYLYTITGVAENVPSNSTIAFNFLASTASLKMMPEAKRFLESQYTDAGDFTTYLLLKHPQDSTRVQRSMQSLLKNGPATLKGRLDLTQMTKLHLKNGFGDSSNIKYLKIFPFVAGLILLLALFNYMSLSTARSTLRAKEVGVRKVNGASRRSIALQFFIESALFTCVAFIMGYFICYMLKSWFLNTLQLKVDESFLYSAPVLFSLSGLLIITIIFAGSYPSIVLSSFKPVITLKGKMSKQAGGKIVRKVFTTFQFAISVGLIICGIIIDRQLYYFRHTDTGVSRENVLMVPISDGFGKQYQSFKGDVRSLAGVTQVATSRYPMYKGYNVFFIPGNAKNESFPMPALTVDKSFISILNIKWKIAPLFRDAITGSKKIVINEAVIAKLNLPANPIGSTIDFGGKEKNEIVGVIKNFNFNSLESTIGPLCLFVSQDTVSSWGVTGACLFVKIKPYTNLPTFIESVQNIYKKYDKESAFSYSFMDDAFNEQYKAEDRLASIFSIFTGITVLLAAMGLFGLAAFTIEQRTKEIGIRKVLGASLSTITAILSADFLKLVLLAVLIASPFAWWAMHNWLQSFAYRISIQWWMFGSAGFLAVLVAALTISYHSIKAAIANPADSLRSE